MESDPGCKEGHREQDVMSQFRLQCGNRKVECREFHYSCKSKNVGPSPAYDKVDEGNISDVMNPTSDDIDLVCIIETTDYEVPDDRRVSNFTTTLRG